MKAIHVSVSRGADEPIEALLKRFARKASPIRHEAARRQLPNRKKRRR